MKNVFAVVILALALGCGPAQKKPVSSPLAPGTKVNVNTATEATLKTLPGIGGKEAKEIVAHREKNGPFATVDDLKKVKKLGGKDVEKLRPYAVTQ